MEQPKTTTTLPWCDLFRSASFRLPNADPFETTRAISESPETEKQGHTLGPEIKASNARSLSMDHYRSRTLEEDPDSSSTALPWKVMFRSASFRGPELSPRTTITSPPLQENIIIPEESSSADMPTNIPSDPQIRLALYITLAQALLAVVIFLFYGGFKLLEEYLRPVVWAALCSIPLRGIQDTLVEFWSEPLRLGLMDTILAVPVAIIKVLVSTIVDAREVFNWVSPGNNKGDIDVSRASQGSGFVKLLGRLVSFGLFILAFEQTGRIGALILLGSGFMFSSSLSESTISTVSSMRSDSFRLRHSGGSLNQPSKIGKMFTHWILSRLKAIIAMSLITGMIFALLGGAVFLSYKIGVEGKDAMISIKSYIAESNYAEKMGIDENNFMEMVDWYTNECYMTLSRQIDNLGHKYNLTELLQAIKHLIQPREDGGSDYPISYSVGLRNLSSMAKEMLISREEVFNKAKCFAAQGIDISLEAFSGSKFVLEAFANVAVSIGSSMASLLNFLLQCTVFFWVLYYLITTETGGGGGGVTEQLVKTVPFSVIPRAKRARVVHVLNTAVCGVLLATAKIALYQGCLTWLMCRLYSVHFVYLSTVAAMISPLLPIFPPWLPTVPAALQLLLDGRYVLAVSFCVTYLLLMDYGWLEIAGDVPGYSAYLTGVSIIGGIALFPSPLEGAIIGPLITTLVIALKDLYAEFILNDPGDKVE